MPNGKQYYSPRGLYPFQAEAVADVVVLGRLVGVLDVGLGKTHIAMCTAAKLYELGLIDQVMWVGRRGKVADHTEFPADIAEFTSFSLEVYHGTGREKRLERHGVPQVFMTTYETGKAELVQRVPVRGRSNGKLVPGPLATALGLPGKRTLWIFDEITKFVNRGSDLYKAYWALLAELRREHQQYVLGLTATPFQDDFDQAFNIGRLVAPAEMPAIGVYEAEFMLGKDDRNRPVFNEAKRPAFAAMFQTIIYRKRGTDDDVASQMPSLLPDFWPCELDPTQRKLYDRIEQVYFDEDTQEYSDLDDQAKSHLSVVLKIVAGHPAGLLHADDPLAREIVGAIGEPGLRAIGSGKTLALIERLNDIVTKQGDQVVVFTFWANTVLPEVAADLRAAGFAVGVYDGSASSKEAKARFKAGEHRVLVASDAGSEGLNLPEASYVIEYETARTAATRTQRFGRGTRLTSDRSVVHGITMLANDTREVGMLRRTFKRKGNQDTLLGDHGSANHISVEDLRALLRASYEESE